MMIARARRSRSWRSGSATEVWWRTCSCFIELLPLFILREEPENGETGLSPHLPLQLLHLRLDYQIYRFMGCDCHIELAFKRLKSLAQLGHLPKADEQSARAWLYGKLFVALLTEQLIRQGQALSPCRPLHSAEGPPISLARIRIRLTPNSACNRTRPDVALRTSGL
jgi:hypothetical protein